MCWRHAVASWCIFAPAKLLCIEPIFLVMCYLLVWRRLLCLLTVLILYLLLTSVYLWVYCKKTGNFIWNACCLYHNFSSPSKTYLTISFLLWVLLFQSNYMFYCFSPITRVLFQSNYTCPVSVQLHVNCFSPINMFYCFRLQLNFMFCCCCLMTWQTVSV